ncbi:hypothetical protein DFJ74DRAFT_647119 [Hyaloraphidium curvatum]|nr:hypothetical protein DFJ74DRAFT_647119 [Hyaloraphidium curvatum]
MATATQAGFSAARRRRAAALAAHAARSSGRSDSSFALYVAGGVLASAAAAALFYAYLRYSRPKRRDADGADANRPAAQAAARAGTPDAPGQRAPASPPRAGSDALPDITYENRRASLTPAAARRPASARKPQRKLTISAKDIILWNASPDPESPNLGFLPQAAPFLHALLRSNAYDLHLITESASAAERDAVLELLRSAGLEASGLDFRKVLFCSSAEGRAHMVRHLEPHVHVEPAGRSEPEAVAGLWKHVPRVIRVVKARHPGGRRASTASIGDESEVVPEGPNVEIAGSVMGSSLAKEVGFAK